MDKETFKLLTSFIVRARRLVGTVDSSQLLEDANYASKILQKVEMLGDIEVVMLSIKLRQKLGLQDGAMTNDVSLTQTATNLIRNDNYKFGDRG